ncbi:MAG: serine/threonine protein kinase [Planctomycetes bacterium]|nr:serine/threonine protein kinase [Planctomycetota bacterium]
MKDSTLETGDSERERALVDAAWRQMDASPEQARMGGNAPPLLRSMDARDGFSTLSTDSFAGYDLVREIHRGGQGVVYQAIQHSTNRKVAIKVLKEGPFAGPADKARFEREIQILGQLQHPNIVTIHDSGSEAGHFYFVMDYIRGQPLDVFVASGDRSIDELLRLFEKICDAVNAAHLRGVIHRDLKPSNIRVDENGEPHVLDFGLAKVSADDAKDVPQQVTMTVTGQFIGSLPWASPEQVEGTAHRVDVRTDVYSLGVVLFHMLTGRFPYNVAENMRNVVDNILTVDSPKPSSIRRKINDEVDTIVLKCLCKEPERRYQSAGEVARDIQRYLAGEPIEAKRNSTWYVLRKAVRRHRVPAAFALLVLIMIVGSAIGLGVSYRRESRLRAEAARQADIAQAVNQFLIDDLLAAVNPGEQGRDVTMLEVLDAASESIVGKFVDQPLVEAAIRETLGHTYMELGEWKTALPHGERALAMRRAELGSEHADTLSTIGLVARLYRRMARYDESEALFREMLSTARDVLGDEHDLTTKAMSNLAVLYCELGRFDEALLLNGQVMKIRLETLGEEHKDTLTSLNNQGFCYDNLGRYREAEPLYTRVLEIRRRVLGDEHPHTLYSMSNLSTMFWRLGQFDEAERLQARRVELGRRVQGERHPHTVRALRNLGEIYRDWRRFKRAEPLLVGALETQRQLTGDEHPATTSCLVSLSRLYQLQQRFDEAEILYAQALAIRRRVSGPENRYTFTAMLHLADLYLDWGKFDEAEHALKEVPLELHGKPTDWWIESLHLRGLLGRAYVGQGRHDEAEPLFREALALRRESLGEVHPDVSLCLDNLGSFLLTRDRLEEAEPILREGLEIRRELFGDGHVNLATSLENLGLLFQRKGDYGEAESLLLEVLRIRERAHGANHPDTQKTMNGVIDLYEAWGRPEKADEYRARVPRTSLRVTKNHAIGLPI